MVKVGIPDLDAPVRPLSLSYAVQPNNMIFLHRNQTRMQLANALSTAINIPINPAVRAFLLAGEVECLLTFMVCAFMIYKKQSLGKLWIITRRNSPHGRFYVSNALLVLMLGVSAYLIAWNTTALAVVAYSFANVSTLQWTWIVPLPWLPLLMGAYVSMHGFVVGCSPRSPLASIQPRDEASRRKWYYLPVVKSALVANLTLIVPCALFSGSTITLTIMSANAYYCARHFANQTLPADVLRQMADHFARRSSTLPDPDAIVSEELVWMARHVAARYMETKRYMDINLCIFAGGALVLLLPTYLYGVPNVMSLIDHACLRYPEPIPESCTNFPRKVWFMLTKGRPSAGDSSKDINLSRWKMTMLAVAYVIILCASVPAFAWIPVYIVGDGYHRILAGNTAPTYDGSLLAVSLVTIFSCTFIAAFCTVATLDPVFRAAIGLNLLRTQVTVDITVEVEKVTRCSSDHRSIARGKHLTLAFKPSNSSFGSMSRKSPTFGSMSALSPMLGSMPTLSPTFGSMPKSPTAISFADNMSNDAELGFRYMANVEDIEEVLVDRAPSSPQKPPIS